MDVFRSLRRFAIRTLQTRRTERGPTHPWAVSGVLLLALIGIGWSALPGSLSDGTATLRLADRDASGGTLTTAVFALREDGTAVRFGNAELAADGVIRVGLYNPLDRLVGIATEPMLLPADPRLLWLLASSSERNGLREQASALLLSFTAASSEILRSPEFNASYRDRFVAVFQDAMAQAWQATQDSGAWGALLRSYEPILRDAIARDIRPVIEQHFRTVPLRMLRENALPLVDVFGNRPWNMEPVEEALRAALLEIRERSVPEHTVMRLLDSPATIDFLNVFQTTLIGELARSEKLQGLIAAMVFDEQLRPYLAPVAARANDLFRSAPHLMLSLHGSTDINLVAGTVIRTMIGGRPDKVVVFMSPTQRHEITAIDHTVVHLLDRLPPNG